MTLLITQKLCKKWCCISRVHAHPGVRGAHTVPVSGAPGWIPLGHRWAGRCAAGGGWLRRWGGAGPPARCSPWGLGRWAEEHSVRGPAHCSLRFSLSDSLTQRRLQCCFCIVIKEQVMRLAGGGLQADCRVLAFEFRTFWLGIRHPSAQDYSFPVDIYSFSNDGTLVEVCKGGNRKSLGLNDI